MIVCQVASSIITDVKTVSVIRIEPEGVIIAVNTLPSEPLPGTSAIFRILETAGQPVNQLIIEWINPDMAVIEWTILVPVNEYPVRSAILGAIHPGTRFGHVLVVGISAARLVSMLIVGHQDVGIAPADGQSDFP